MAAGKGRKILLHQCHCRVYRRLLETGHLLQQVTAKLADMEMDRHKNYSAELQMLLSYIDLIFVVQVFIAAFLLNFTAHKPVLHIFQTKYNVTR